MAHSDFKITPQKITGLNLVKGLVEEPVDPRSTSCTLRFWETTKVGKKLTMNIDMPTLVIIQYLRENGTEGRHIESGK